MTGKRGKTTRKNTTFEARAFFHYVLRVPNRPPRRQFRIVAEEPYRKGGRARLFSYGYRAIALLAMCNERTVRNAVKARQLHCESLADVMRWVEHRTHYPMQTISCAPRRAGDGDPTCALALFASLNATEPPRCE